MDRKKLEFCFHNPNTNEETAKCILKIFAEANIYKIERAVQESLKEMPVSKG